jgi:Rrf2 family iron-sulfur cluster assembly transcriptional regulator
MRTALSDDAALEDGPHGDLYGKVIDPLWSELDQAFAAQLQGLTVDDLVKRAESAGLARPLAEPITFSI